MKAYVVFIAIVSAAVAGYAVPDQPEGTYAALPGGYEIDWDSLKIWAQVGFGVLAAAASANPKVKAIYDKVTAILSKIPGLGFLFDGEGPEADVQRLVTDAVSFVQHLRELIQTYRDRGETPPQHLTSALASAQAAAKSAFEESIQ